MSARSDHFPSFHPVSSLQLPYIVGHHGLNAGRSSHCFLTRCSDVLQQSANYSPVVHDYLLAAQFDCVFDLVLGSNVIHAALDHFFLFSCNTFSHGYFSISSSGQMLYPYVTCVTIDVFAARYSFLAARKFHASDSSHVYFC